MVRWEQRFPGRLEYELSEFERRGLAFTLDDEEFAAGRVVLDGSVLVDGASVALTIVFPDAYPIFRPEVYASELVLARHQNPYDKNLCLLETPTRAWNTSDTAAWLVAERVPFLLGLVEAGGVALARNEVPQGEPESFYIPRAPGTAVLLPEEALRLPPDLVCGDAYFAFSEERVGTAVHALLRQVNGRSPSGKSEPIAHASEDLRARFSGPVLQGRWVRVERPPGRDPETYFAAAEDVHRGFGHPPWQTVGGDEIAILGVVYREEVQQGVWEDGWLFAIRFRQKRPNRQSGSYLTKGERAAADDFFARVPRLRGIEAKAAALLGLGALGAPLALELARAQLGELRLLDDDLVDAGTIVRWPIGLPAIGSAKTAVIEGTIAQHYPRTVCRTTIHRLGTATADHERENDFDVLEQLFSGADVAVDASAEIGVQQLVADVAREHELPQVYVWATEGAYGGVVARVQPGETGCWFCLQLALDDGSIVAPPREPAGTTQPRGCGTPTFTGESFNLLPIVAQAARVTTGVLLQTLPIGQDVSVMALRAGNDATPAPIWTTYSLERYSRCPVCASADA